MSDIRRLLAPVYQKHVPLGSVAEKDEKTERRSDDN